MIRYIKSLISDPVGRWFFIALILATTLSTIIGFVMAPYDFLGSDFLGNLLAEVAGNALSILVGIVVIDRFIEYRRGQQWAKVRHFTFNALATHLCEIGAYIFIHYPGVDYEAIQPVFAGHGQPPDTKTLSGFDGVLGELNKLPGGLSDYDYKSTSDIAIEYYEAVRWDLDQIQNVLTPRLIQSPVDQEFKDLLIEFDSVRRDLHHAIIAHQEVVIGGAFAQVISLIKSARSLYQAIYERWETL
jgi:hypothetical protein